MNDKVNEKWCTKCKTTHDRSEFNRDASRGDGLHAACRPSRRKPRKTIAERLAAKTVAGQHGCLLWTGSTYEFGHGVIWNGKFNEGAHRVAWTLANGPIPSRMCVCHRCDTPACVNPDHLFLGTKADNAADMASKGRASHRPGASSPSAKLTADDVAEIRKLKGIVSQRALAERFGVSKTAIRFVQKGRTWQLPSP